MSTGELGYLALVLMAFCAIAAVIAYGSISTALVRKAKRAAPEIEIRQTATPAPKAAQLRMAA